ncbi:RNA polymerase II mediator complex subunit [Oleoguttula sp. CCFEE 5521]
MAALAFQPWPLVAPKKPALIDILTHISLERGHFRDITESSLQEELAAADALSPSSSDSADDYEETTSKSAAKVAPSTRQELYAVKKDMLCQLDEAQRQISDAVQFMSLLNSEHTPAAEKSLSKAYMGPVQGGTLGTDIWQRMDADYAREGQHEHLAQNVKMRGLQESADSLLGAAKRLEVNVKKETEYWNQMLSISEKGWNVCRVGGRSNRLGVRFGFSESAGEFAGRSVAALQTDSEGSISLERGVGVKPKGLRVSVIRDGQVVGRSYLRSVADSSESTLGSRIRRARDSIFDEELYREMLLECRTMTAVGVRLKGSAIEVPYSVDADARTDRVELDLVPLSAETGTQLNIENPDDTLAQALALACRLLLTEAHRERLNARSATPQPLAERKVEKPVVEILRPIAALLSHSEAMQSLNAHLHETSTLLLRASVKSQILHAYLKVASEGDSRGVDALASTIKGPLISTAQLDIEGPGEQGNATLTVKIETSSSQKPASTFTIVGQRGEQIMCDDCVSAQIAADETLAMLLAHQLQSQAGSSWICCDEEAVLTKEADDRDDIVRTERVEISVGREVIAMGLTDQTLEWTVDTNVPEIGFWHAGLKYLGA